MPYSGLLLSDAVCTSFNLSNVDAAVTRGKALRRRPLQSPATPPSATVADYTAVPTSARDKNITTRSFDLYSGTQPRLA